MASALARGWGEPVLVSDVDEDRARALAEDFLTNVPRPQWKLIAP